MKKISVHWIKNRLFLVFAAWQVFAFLAPGIVQAQPETKINPAQEEVELISPSLDFTCTQKNDNTVNLKAILRGKVEGTFVKFRQMKITFYQASPSGEQEMGAVHTNSDGIALLNVKSDSIATDETGKFHFKAVFEGNKSMESAEEEISFAKAQLTVNPLKEDSLFTVGVKLTDPSTGNPVPEATIGIYVHRLFKPLKIAEGTTDENGEMSVEIPQNLPGDAKGNLHFLARLDESDEYGNLETSFTEAWGKPVSDQLQELPRALWSSHPPIWMLVTFIILMTAVWGHYIVIVYELFRLRKEEPESV
ncbi:MAG: hypothetical protein GC171_08570 [Terrimonas sp.]|nr:hypothetical protein [Terrimonas sp.]